MKGVKDEDKHFDPLFPRININEAERGGPRAPPRNKMALCEQLTIPSSPTTNNGSMSMMPLSRSSTHTRIIASSPPSHADWRKNDPFSPFSGRNWLGVSPGYHDVSLRHHAHPSNGVTNSTIMPPEFRSLLPISYQSEVHWPPTSKNGMLQPHCFPNSRNSTAEENREHVNYVRLPSFSSLGRSTSNGNARKLMGKHDHPLSCTNSSGTLQTAVEKQLTLTNVGQFKEEKAEGSCCLPRISEHHMENISSAKLTKENMCRAKLDTKLDTNTVSHGLVSNKSAKLKTSAFTPEHPEQHEEVNSTNPQFRAVHLKRPAYLLSDRSKTLDAASGLSPRNRSAESKDLSVHLIGQENNRLLDDENRFNEPYIHMHPDYKSLKENEATKDCLPASSMTSIRKRSAGVMEGPSGSKEEHEYKHASLTKPTSMDKSHSDKDCGSEPGGTSDRSNAMSDASVEKSIPNYVVSPKDVVRAIGQERFWKARRTILHQQRILAAQLFDLHRLVKVQRLMAESPEMLSEGNFYIRKSSIKLSHSRKLFPDTNEEAKAILQESNFKLEHAPESASRKAPLLNTDKEFVIQQPIPVPCPGALVVPPINSITKSSPLLFHPPPGNQWLVPVRSPSEGLVYKPYTGPLPPTGGILSPVYDNITPISLTGMGDQTFLNAAYCLPASNLEGFGNLSGHSNLQPYPMPINASGSNSTFEAISKFVKHPIADQDSNVPIYSIQTHRNGVVLECSKHLEGCKGNALHESTSSCPVESNKAGTLSLFPTTPSHQPHLSTPASERKIQVIKVVPHNRKLASESAARIFQTIQEERKQLG